MVTKWYTDGYQVVTKSNDHPEMVYWWLPSGHKKLYFTFTPKNGHLMQFCLQNIESRIYALLSVIRQQMSAFDPFGGWVGGGRQKRTMSAFSPFFLYESFP